MALDFDARDTSQRALATATTLLGAIKAGPDLIERFVREGDPWSSVKTVTTAVPVATGNAYMQIAASPNLPLVGKIAFIDSIGFSLSAAAMAQVYIYPNAANAYVSYLWNGLVGANTPVMLPVRQIFRQYNVSATVPNVTVQVINNMTAGTVNYNAAVSLSGWRITDDLNFNADRTVLFAGDSLLDGVGTSSTAKMWCTIVRDYLRQQGSSTVRMVLKSVSGSTSTQHEAWRSAGYHDVQRADFGFYALSVNDAAQAVPAATYAANLAAYWTWWSKRYPAAPLVLCGATPLENATTESAAAVLRAAASGYVASVGSPLLRYVDLGAAFDRTQGLAVYTSTDTAGARVHPNDSGHAAIGAAMTAALTAQGIGLR